MSTITPVAKKLTSNIEKVIIGKRQEIILSLVSFFCEGHILLEDVPGVAKTVLARSLSQSIGCSFNRAQCTPDLLPTDITGASVFNPKTTEFEFRRGPIFSNILLADEINRATPRTQSALLEAMADRRVPVDGTTYDLDPRAYRIEIKSTRENACRPGGRHAFATETLGPTEAIRSRLPSRRQTRPFRWSCPVPHERVRRSH